VQSSIWWLQISHLTIHCDDVTVKGQLIYVLTFMCSFTIFSEEKPKLYKSLAQYGP